jgi:hypothetical protein
MGADGVDGATCATTASRATCGNHRERDHCASMNQFTGTNVPVEITIDTLRANGFAKQAMFVDGGW